MCVCVCVKTSDKKQKNVCRDRQISQTSIKQITFLLRTRPRPLHWFVENGKGEAFSRCRVLAIVEARHTGGGGGVEHALHPNVTPPPPTKEMEDVHFIFRVTCEHFFCNTGAFWPVLTWLVETGYLGVGCTTSWPSLPPSLHCAPFSRRP